MILVIIILLSDDTFHLSSVAHFQAQTHLHTCHIWVCLCTLLQTTADSTDTHGNLAVLILHCSSHKSAIVHCCWQKSRKRTRRTLKNSLTVCHSQCVRVCVCVKVIKQHKKTSEQKLTLLPSNCLPYPSLASCHQANKNLGDVLGMLNPTPNSSLSNHQRKFHITRVLFFSCPLNTPFFICWKSNYPHIRWGPEEFCSFTLS